MGTSISLSVRYSEEDYEQAKGLYYPIGPVLMLRRVPYSAYFFVAALFLLFVTSTWVMVAGMEWIWITVVLVSGGMLYIMLRYAVLPLILFRWKPNYERDYEFVFENKGIEFKSGSQQLRFPWECFHYAFVSDELYLLE